MTEKDLSQKIDWSITSLYTKVAIGLLITTTILPLTVKGFSEILNKIWHFNEPGSPSIQFGDQPIVIGEGARVNENESCVFMPTVDLSNDGE